MASRVYVLCGLPGSGKSKWAKMTIHKDTNCVIVNKDSLREMFHGGDYVFDDGMEKVVKNCVSKIISSCLYAGKNIIVDECCITRAYREELVRYLHFVLPPPAVSIILIWFKDDGNSLRNRMQHPRGKSTEYWERVINDMKSSFEPPDTSEPFNEIVEVSLTEDDKVFYNKTK